MPYKVKRGVVLVLSRPVENLLDIMEIAVNQTDRIFFWVTSGVEGGHGPESLHYEARAVDIGDHRKGWTPAIRQKIFQELAQQRKLFPQLHFLPESDHLHLEWREK